MTGSCRQAAAFAAGFATIVSVSLVAAQAPSKDPCALLTTDEIQGLAPTDHIGTGMASVNSA